MPEHETFNTTERAEQMIGEQRRRAFEARSHTASEIDRPTPFTDRGIVDVPVADLPQPEGIAGRQDFEKISPEEMAAGFSKLEAMKPYIDSGVGRNSDYWRAVDQANGVSYPDGYQKIYEVFYGDGAVRVYKTGDEYSIDKGRHRIAVAKALGLSSMPVHLHER